MFVRYLSLWLFLVVGLTSIKKDSFLVSKLEAFAPKLEFHFNEEKAREDYERACRDAEEGRKYEREQQERRDREERDRKAREERALEEARRHEEWARDQRERDRENFPR